MPVKLRKPLGSVAAQSIERKARDVPPPIGLNNYIIIFLLIGQVALIVRILRRRALPPVLARSQRLRQKIAGQEERASDSGRQSSRSELQDWLF
jgi:hypothetical protein